MLARAEPAARYEGTAHDVEKGAKKPKGASEISEGNANGLGPRKGSGHEQNRVREESDEATMPLGKSSCQHTTR